MKKLTVLSVIAASLLLVGCGDAATGAEAKAAAEQKTESTMKCQAGKCGAAMKEKAAETKSAATEAKEAAATAVEKTKEAVAEKATEVKAAVAATATAAVESTKEAATAAVETTKEAATAVAEKATEAVAAATGPDGKALFAKCSGCHGTDGKTSAMGKSALLAGQSAADLETKINEYKAGTRNVAGMGTLMQGQVSSLSDADVKAISAYVAGL